jgi:N-formylglutamate amidohydrolase
MLATGMTASDRIEQHFQVLAPQEPGPVVVEIPHAGLLIDDTAQRFTRIPDDALARGALFADSDIGAERLWLDPASPISTAQVTCIVARASRYVVDLNTEPVLPTPYEEKLPAPLRAVTRYSACGARWTESALPRHELDRRIREVFEPYHEAIRAEIARVRARHGVAVLISSHTFPDRMTPGAADVVLGTLHGASAPESLRDALADAVRAHALSVGLEAPFAGGFSLRRHGRRDAGVIAIQIEIARRLICPAPSPRAPADVDEVGLTRVARMLLVMVDRIAAWLATEYEHGPPGRHD